MSRDIGNTFVRKSVEDPMLTLAATLMIAKTTLFAPKHVVIAKPKPVAQTTVTRQGDFIVEEGQCIGMRIVSSSTPLLPRN